MRRPRHLSKEERALWDQVARRADPLRKSAPLPAPETPKPKPPRARSAKTVDPIPDFRIGDTAPETGRDNLAPALSDGLRAAPVRMDARSHKKMTRGKLKPEARLDLHGMTLDVAHPELVAFVLGSQQLGRRLVLVITGKGKQRDDGGPMPARRGILRHQVPQWLSIPPLSAAVLEVRPAHVRHGGDGAYYVYLRRRR